ncbi:hypothetical protein B0H11DRAFT_1913748 [Mycena galericulata]|nr:hypothetical protein B0H11DRAFT_1913748 [Mycena galericulata]
MTRRACSSNPLAARVIWSTATQARLGIVEISAIFRPTKNKYSVTGDVWERSPGQAVRVKHARHRPSLLLAAAGGRRDVGTTRKPRPAAGWERTGAHRSHGLIPERLRTSAHRAVQDAGVNVLKVYFVRRTSLDSCNCNWNGTHLGRREGGCMVFRERMKIGMEFEWISCIFELEEEQGSTSFSATAHQTTDLTHLLDSLQFNKGHSGDMFKASDQSADFQVENVPRVQTNPKLRWPGLRVTSLKVNM